MPRGQGLQGLRRLRRGRRHDAPALVPPGAARAERSEEHDGGNGDRGPTPVAHGRASPWLRRARRIDPIGPHRPLDVLDPLLAHKGERQGQLALDLVIGGARDQDAAGLRQALQAGGDVDAVAEEIAVLEDHVAQIDADAEADALVLRRVRLPLGHALLDQHGALHGVDHAAELAQRAIAHELDDAAVVLGDQRLDEALAVVLETLDRSGLVALHQARIADHIGRENGSEASVGTRGGHDEASQPFVVCDL